jgi:hypothetical protein
MGVCSERLHNKALSFAGWKAAEVRRTNELRSDRIYPLPNKKLSVPTPQ